MIATSENALVDIVGPTPLHMSVSQQYRFSQPKPAYAILSSLQSVQSSISLHPVNIWSYLSVTARNEFNDIILIKIIP